MYPLKAAQQMKRYFQSWVLIIRQEAAKALMDPIGAENKPNKIGRCVISYVGRVERSFCMVDRDQRDCPKLMAAMQHSRGTRLTQLPPAGQVFGVYLDGSLFRAVRNKSVERCPLKTPYIRLLDTGEVLPHDDSIILCDLSEYYRKLPAYAIRCKLVNVMDDPFCDDLHQYLVKNLHTNQHFKVIWKEGSILSLKLSQQPIPHKVPISPVSKLKSAKTVRVLPPSPKKESTPRLNIFKPEPVDQTSAASIRLPVVMPQPDGNHCCPFFDPVLASCSKGAHSKRDVIPVRNSQQDVIRVVPPIGCQVHLITKFIKDVEHFWCHVVSPDYTDSDLLEMEMRMNAQENSMHFRKLDKPPYFAQQVFAKYVDKRWYRAEIAEYFNENNVLVFYVDYGNAELVRMEEIRLWDEKFSYLPYQAVFCRLANVRRVKPNHKPAVVEMNRKLLNQRILATIVNNGCPWEVILYDKDGFDLSTGLLMAHLAKKITDDDDVNSSDDESLDAVAGA